MKLLSSLKLGISRGIKLRNISTMDLINEIKLKIYLLLEQLCTQKALCLTTETLPVCITAALFCGSKETETT